MILLRLFIEFFKIGLFAIGEGMATIVSPAAQPQYRLVPAPINNRYDCHIRVYPRTHRN